MAARACAARMTSTAPDGAPPAHGRIDATWWRDTRIQLPANLTTAGLRDALGNLALPASTRTLAVGDLLRTLPVAVLVSR